MLEDLGAHVEQASHYVGGLSPKIGHFIDERDFVIDEEVWWQETRSPRI
jgi:hypothetical protein